MFKSKYIIGIALAILTGFSSCANLDLDPLGSPEAGEISEERQAFLRLAAVYSGMKDFRYTWSMQCFGDVLSEDATFSGSSNDAAGFTLMENYQYPADHTAISDKYTYSYMCINKANLFIRDMESADDALFSEYNKEQMIGEAKFIRAYTYFELVKTFGGVPCYTGVLELDHERLGRASVEDVYAVIEQDLNDAVAVLPKKSEISNYETKYAGRITKGAALAMQTRVYLYEKKYDEVKRAFEKFQNECGDEYSLVSPDQYAWQFSLDGEHCSASILEINMYNSTTQSSYNVNNGNRHVLMSMPRNMTIGFGCAQPTQALADAYDAEGDVIRKNTTLLSREEAIEIEVAAKGEVAPITDDRTGWYNRKLYLKPGEREENRGNNQPTNLRLIRLAEVYLNYAEACYFTGDITNAHRYLNEVRSRVNLAPKNNSGDQLFEDIMNERHLEFGMEGFRFFDVVRVGWGERVFSHVVKYGEYAMNPFHAGAEVLPIPQSEIDISGGLITN
ncbi:RagB/SusD family nutrient uptake outer membrane protein [uncultured Parabacteroides sp.]|uniref:RagB/SusD family nutrient uptake outer membrane protein n=1 Tax=uncultured Parabacteroides sp. TaxID=512312 RepID=UPI00262CBB86|nr:RagB/SusD family nutrient uptake outer membrane protein [uncultured Parabacteroides sp.]